MGKMKELSIEADNNDPTLVTKALDINCEYVADIINRMNARQAAQSEAAGCKACEFLLQICEQGEVVCKVCGRDDYARENDRG